MIKGDAELSSVYVRFEPVHQQYSRIFSPFPENLSRDDLQEVFLQSFHSLQPLKTFQDAPRPIKFGITDHHESDAFHRRHSNYNCQSIHFDHAVFDFVPPRQFHQTIIAKSGDRFVLNDGRVVILAPIDIRRLELIAIHLVSFGCLSNFREYLLNIAGGGESALSPQTLYFRTARRVEKPASIVACCPYPLKPSG